MGLGTCTYIIGVCECVHVCECICGVCVHVCATLCGMCVCVYVCKNYHPPPPLPQITIVDLKDQWRKALAAVITKDVEDFFSVIQSVTCGFKVQIE